MTAWNPMACCACCVQPNEHGRHSVPCPLHEAEAWDAHKGVTR